MCPMSSVQADVCPPVPYMLLSAVRPVNGSKVGSTVEASCIGKHKYKDGTTDNMFSCDTDLDWKPTDCEGKTISQAWIINVST